MLLSVAIPEGCDPGTYAGMARELFTLVVNFNPGMVGGGIGSLLHKVFSYKIPGERPAGFRHIGGGAGNTADGCDLAK